MKDYEMLLKKLVNKASKNDNSANKRKLFINN